MERFVNAVGTRVVDGDHAAALRWYADHVQQLLAFPALDGAALYRRVDDGDGYGAAPEMLCLYDFGTAEAFAAYERSDVFAAAARDRLASWGRDGIAITSRLQYHRVVRLERGAAPATPAWHVAAWTGERGAAVERAIAAGALARGVAAQTLLRGAGEPGYLVLERGGTAAPTPPAGLAPAWHGRFECVATWSR